MTTRTSNKTRLLAALVLLAIATSAGAQKRPQKKLYCWNQNGQRTCGDALPPGAIDLARTEINSQSGLATGTVARALTAEERAAADAAARQAEVDAAAEAVRQRRDMAMIASYDTEADLRRAYNERITLVDLAIKASVLGETNLRTSLVSQLNRASSVELDGKPVTPAVLASIRSQHANLRRQQRILSRQRNDRMALDDELAEALARYRKLKHPEAVAEPQAAPTPANGG